MINSEFKFAVVPPRSLRGWTWTKCISREAAEQEKANYELLTKKCFKIVEL